MERNRLQSASIDYNESSDELLRTEPAIIDPRCAKVDPRQRRKRDIIRMKRH